MPGVLTLLQETGGSFLKNALCWTRSGFPRVGSWESKFATYSIVLWESGIILLDKTFLYRKSKWPIYYGTSQVLTRRRIWLTWFLKLIGPQTPLYSIPTKKKTLPSLPLYILRDGSPRPRLSKPQPSDWWSIFAVLLERSHSCLSLCCLWPYSKQDNSLPKIPTCRNLGYTLFNSKQRGQSGGSEGNTGKFPYVTLLLKCNHNSL